MSIPVLWEKFFFVLGFTTIVLGRTTTASSAQYYIFGTLCQPLKILVSFSSSSYDHRPPEFNRGSNNP